MIKYFIILTFLTQSVKAQERPVQLGQLRFDGTRKNWSDLDRMYLIAKAIHPASYVVPSADTLTFSFSILEGPVDSAYLIYLRNSTYDAISEVAFHKDSMKRYNIAAIQMCSDSSTCATWLYHTKDHRYRKKSIEEKLQIVAPSFYCTTSIAYFSGMHKKRSILLFHSVDTNSLYSKSYYLQSFYQSVTFIIADILQHSKRRVKNRYEDIVSVFHSGDKLLNYSRFKLKGENFSKVYGFIFFNSLRPKGI